MGSPGDGAGEAVGGCGAQRDGGRRFAGLSGLEKQGSRDGASAEQGSSFRVEEEKDRIVRGTSPPGGQDLRSWVDAGLAGGVASPGPSDEM